MCPGEDVDRRVPAGLRHSRLSGRAPPGHTPPPRLHPTCTRARATAPKPAPVDTGWALAWNANPGPRSRPPLGARSKQIPGPGPRNLNFREIRESGRVLKTGGPRLGSSRPLTGPGRRGRHGSPGNVSLATVPAGPALFLTLILFPFRYFCGSKPCFALGTRLWLGVRCSVSSLSKMKPGYLRQPCGFPSREPKSVDTTSAKEARVSLRDSCVV